MQVSGKEPHTNSEQHQEHKASDNNPSGFTSCGRIVESASFVEVHHQGFGKRGILHVKQSKASRILVKRCVHLLGVDLDHHFSGEAVSRVQRIVHRHLVFEPQEGVSSENVITHPATFFFLLFLHNDITHTLRGNSRNDVCHGVLDGEVAGHGLRSAVVDSVHNLRKIMIMLETVQKMEANSVDDFTCSTPSSTTYGTTVGRAVGTTVGPTDGAADKFSVGDTVGGGSDGAGEGMVEGLLDGAFVGANEGPAVLGEALGIRLGTSEGSVVGSGDGLADGSCEGGMVGMGTVTVYVGIAVGTSDGIALGVIDGSSDGAFEGVQEGFAVGEAEGLAEGCSEGGAVGIQSTATTEPRTASTTAFLKEARSEIVMAARRAESTELK